MGKTEQPVNVILWAAAWDGGWGGTMHEHQGEGWSERWTVDGLEDSPRGRLARVELPSGRTRTVPLHELPEGVREGDLIEVRRGVGGIVFRRLEAETEAARLQAQSRLERLNTAALNSTTPKDEVAATRNESLSVNEAGEITL